MKKIYLLLVVCVLLFCQYVRSNELPGGNLPSKISGTRKFFGSPVNAVTVAGGNGAGSAANQLYQPIGFFVDATGNIYISDFYNSRIQKWAPGASSGVTVVSLPSIYPTDVFVDVMGNIFVAAGGSEIRKYTPGSSTGVIVAGGNGSGSAANQMNNPNCVFVDAQGNVYVGDSYNSRIQKWSPGATSGVVVAGGNGYGNRDDQLSSIADVFVDFSGNVYVADRDRVVRWAPGATTGVTVAFGFQGATGVFVDAAGFLFVSDSYGHSVEKWVPGAQSGTIVAGGNGRGQAPNQFDVVAGVFVDQAGNIYASDEYNHRIQKFGSPDPVDAGSPAMGITVAGSFFATSDAASLNNPHGIAVDASGNVYISDFYNHRIQKWAPGAAAGVTINGTAVNFPKGIAVDGSGNVYAGIASNGTVVKWAAGSNQGVVVAGGDQSGSVDGICLDEAGNLYIADFVNNRVRKFSPGATQATIVAGGNGAGAAANQLSGPNDVFVDANGNVYVTDSYNNRIQKWAPGASAGLTVAGGNGAGAAGNQLNSPWGVHVDVAGNIYIADGANHRIQKWAPGASTGITIAGGNGRGSAPNQLYYPADVFVDANGNVYVSDLGGNRIQKFGSNSLSYKYYEGNWTALPDFNAIAPVATGGSSNIDIRLKPQGRNDNYAFYWEGKIYIPTAGTYTFETVSDDGSNFYFNTPYSSLAVPTVNNDGAHTSKSASGTVIVPAPGLYPVVVTFFESTGGEEMKLFWSGPGLPRQQVPDAAFGTAVLSDHFAPAAPYTSYNNIIGGNYLTLDWEDGIDDVGVVAYDVYIAGVKTYTTAESKITLSNLSPHTAYTITVTARDLAGNTSDFSYPITLTTSNSLNGLSYKYYEGRWDALPDFSTLTPVKSGTSTNIDLGERTPGRNDNYAFVWQGYINITNPGNYVFETTSDDGSRLYFNSLYSPSATPTLNNDGVHGATTVAASVFIPTVGLYPISITYFEKDGGEQMQVYWSGPGISRQLIPSSAFTPVAPPAGLTYKYYEGDWNALPDFNALTPVKTGTTNNVNLSLKAPGREDNFGFLWEGFINIPAAGSYTFETVSDDGSNLYFNLPYSGSTPPTVNNDGLHASKSATKTVNIATAGSYPIAITYFDKTGGEAMQVYWTGPGIPRQLIPDEAFNTTVTNDNVAPSVPLNLHVVSKGGNFVNLDWDDATDNVGVTAYDVYVGGVKTYSSSNSQLTADNLQPNSTYSFSVKARDFAGNTSGFSAAVNETTVNSLNGLSYKFYQGSWNSLPDFNTLQPAKVGTSQNVDIGVRIPGRDDNFAFVWQGYIVIPAAGDYTFETVSDDGSKLYFNSLYNPSATATVSNDGLHAPASATGTVHIDAPGSYPISITYFEKDGGEQMQVYWSGPGIIRQLIPNAAFTQLPPPTGGLNYRYYEGTWSSLPEFNSLSPVKTGTTPNIDLGLRTPGRNDNFAFVWEGYITIPTAGLYTFETISDDGSRLYFNSFYNTVLETATVFNDGIHAARSSTRVVNIPVAGTYPFAAVYFEATGGETMEAYWTGPGITRQLIPATAFSLAPPSTLNSTASITTLASDDLNKERTTAFKFYPNPFNELLNVQFYNSSVANDIEVAIYDLNGKLVYKDHAGRMPAGNTNLKMKMDRQLLTNGVYMAQIKINGKLTATVKLINRK